MNLSFQLALLAALCVCLSEGAARVRLSEGAPGMRVEGVDRPARKSQRPTRGFRKLEMMTARGFGKRAPPRSELYGLENFWEALEGSPDREVIEGNDEKLDSIPVDLFVNEMLNNPDFARTLVRKFIDLNQDGMLSSEELLRNVA